MKYARYNQGRARLEKKMRICTLWRLGFGGILFQCCMIMEEEERKFGPITHRLPEFKSSRVEIDKLQNENSK